MKPKTTLVLIVLLLLCIGYVLVRHTDLLDRFHSEAIPPRQQPVQPDRRLAAEAFANARAVTIVSSGGQTVVLRKIDGAWRIVEPIRARADDALVGQLVKVLTSLEYLAAVQQADAAPGGLDRPRWTVRLVGPAGGTWAIRVGSALPAKDNQFYVQTEADGRVYVVQADFAVLLTRPLSRYTDTRVLPIAAGEIHSVAMSGPQGSLAIARRGDEWTLHKPISGPLDQAEVRKMLDTLVQMRAKEFLDDSAEALADYRLRPAERLIRLGIRPAGQAEGREISLALGRRTNDRAAVYARVLEQPGAFLIDSLDVQPLHDPLFRIRRKQPLWFDRQDVTGINLQLPAGTAELTRQGETWAMTHPYKGTADAEQVARLLHKLGSIEAEGFVDNVPPAGLAEYGLDKPRGKITLHRAPGRDPVTLSIGAPSRRGDDTVAVTAGGGTVAWIAQRDADRMLWPPATYWDAALLKVPASDEIFKIALQTPMESSVMELVEGIWLLGLPVRGHTDKEHVQRIVRHLQDLKAIRIVSLGPTAAKEYAGDTNRISLAVKTRPATTTQPATRPAGGEKDYIIRMVKKFGKTYVWVDGAKPGAVGVFPGPLYETFSAELRYRKLFGLDPSQIAAVKVLAEDDTFELQRRQTIEGEQWLSPTHPRMHIDTERVRAYLADMLALSAERFLSRNSPEQLDFETFKTWLTIELTTAEGKSVHLAVSSKGPKDQTGRFASARGVHGAFVLSAESVAKLARKLRSFESAGR